jgi:hypothetical protein
MGELVMADDGLPAEAFDAAADMKPIRNAQNRDVYWLLVLSRASIGHQVLEYCLESRRPATRL